MKPIIESIHRYRSDESIAVSLRRENAFERNWHHHPECELTLITCGSGTRQVGDHSSLYGPGDLVLLGPDVPHTWISQNPPARRQPAHEALVVQFREPVLSDALLGLPEFRDLCGLMKRARLGVSFPKVKLPKIRSVMLDVLRLEGRRRWLALVAVMGALSAQEQVTLASPGYAAKTVTRARTRLEKVIQFIDNNASSDLGLQDVSRVAGLSPSAFQRFFQATMRKPFVRYRSERRVEMACERLESGDDPITQIALECGFGSLASFNRQFRAIMGTTPTQFRRGL